MTAKECSALAEKLYWYGFPFAEAVAEARTYYTQTGYCYFCGCEDGIKDMECAGCEPCHSGQTKCNSLPSRGPEGDRGIGI